jgi:beta-glucosidase
VHQPFSLSAPAIAAAGSTFTATTTLPNPSSAPLSDVAMTLSAPAGWSVQATSPSTFATVAGGQTVQTTWQVSVPADENPGAYGLSAQADFTDLNGSGSSSDATTVSLPFPSLTAAYDNPGVSDDANPSAGNLDGGGGSYSAQALAAGTPSLTPGATITHDGLTFSWPDAQPGTPDNVVAGGQTIALSGSGGTLGLLGAGDYGSASGTATITYTDGSTQSFVLGYADWWSNAGEYGDDIVTTVPYLNTTTGRNNHAVSLYYASVPLQSGKTIRYLTLPDISHGAVSGQVALHVFSVAIG